MSRQVINIGAAPNDPAADTGREGGQKINNNFEEIYSRFNEITVDRGFFIDGTNFKLNALWEWVIAGLAYSNPGLIYKPLAYASTGKVRQDIVLLNSENTFYIKRGVEVTEFPVKPVKDDGTIELTSFMVYPSTFGTPTESIVGQPFILKESLGNVALTRTGEVYRLPSSHSTKYNLTDTITIVHGLGLEASDYVPVDAEYPNQIITLYNDGINNKTVKNASLLTECPFIFPNGLDFILTPKTTITFWRDMENQKLFFIGLIRIDPFINVKDFGALGLNVGDDTESFQNALDSAGEFGGRVYVPAGNYRTTGNMVIPKGVTIFGDGGNYSFDYINNTWTNQGSIIFCSSVTNDCFLSNVSGVSFETIAIVNNAVSSPTAGKGINLSNAGFITMNNVSIVGFYDNMHLLNSASSSIMGCHFFNPINYNLFMANPVVPDAGDNAISDCHFSSNTYDLVTNIRWESGGGLKLTNNKFNPGGGGRSKYHIDIEVKGNTSILLLANNSLEGFSQRAINVTSDGTHIFDKIIINGNQMESFDAETTCIEIQGNGQKIRSVNIVNNTMIRSTNSNSDPAVIVNDILQLGMSDNQFRGYINNKSIQNTPNITDFDGNGGTVKGQLGVGNDFTFHGYRGFSNLGVGIGANTSGLLIKTDLESADSENVNLIITGSTASDNLPVETHIQVSNIGNGNIAGAVMLNKGYPFSQARTFYLDGKLCFWVKPDVQYSSYNFEIQSTSKEIIIVDRVLGGLPSGRSGEVTFANYKTIATLDGTIIVADGVADDNAINLGQLKEMCVLDESVASHLVSTDMELLYPNKITGFKVYVPNYDTTSSIYVYTKLPIDGMWSLTSEKSV